MCVCIVFQILYGAVIYMAHSFIPDCNHGLITLLVFNIREFSLIFQLPILSTLCVLLLCYQNN